MNSLYSFKISGKVQGVFFRKTVVYLAGQMGLLCGATNSANPQEVFISLEGEYESVMLFVQDLCQGKAINRCGCIPRQFEIYSPVIALSAHQMNTEKLKEHPIPSGVL